MENTQSTPDDQEQGHPGTHQSHEAIIVESTAVPVDKQWGYVSLEEDLQEDFEELDNIREEEGSSTPFVSPFQLSDALPSVHPQPPITSSPSVSQQPASRRRFPVKSVTIVSLIVVVVASLFSTWVFAKSASPHQGGSSTAHSAARQGTTSLPRPTPTQRTQGKAPTPTPMATPSTQEGLQTDGVPSDQTLQQLGWMAAGRTQADAIQALRTAATFTDREEALVFNEPGTRTGAFFLLTTGGKARFEQNDIRVSSNVLWDTVTRRQLIQLVLHEQPVLVKFATQNQKQQQFVWVDVPFWRWRSQLDPNDQEHLRRTSGVERDPATNQPRVHHMLVLLLRVLPESQGTGAPMGGTGWLVSNYALDATSGVLPDIVSPA